MRPKTAESLLQRLLLGETAGSRLHRANVLGRAARGAAIGGVLGAATGGTISADDARLRNAALGGLAGATIGGVGGGLSGHFQMKRLEDLVDRLYGKGHCEKWRHKPLGKDLSALEVLDEVRGGPAKVNRLIHKQISEIQKQGAYAPAVYGLKKTAAGPGRFTRFLMSDNPYASHHLVQSLVSGLRGARKGALIGAPTGFALGGIYGAATAKPDESRVDAAFRGAGKGALAGTAIGAAGLGGAGFVRRARTLEPMIEKTVRHHGALDRAERRLQNAADIANANIDHEGYWREGDADLVQQAKDHLHTVFAAGPDFPDLPARYQFEEGQAVLGRVGAGPYIKAMLLERDAKRRWDAIQALQDKHGL